MRNVCGVRRHPAGGGSTAADYDHDDNDDNADHYHHYDDADHDDHDDFDHHDDPAAERCLRKPRVYQDIDGVRLAIAGSYQINYSRAL